MRTSVWEVWVKTNTEKKALEVFSRISKKMGRKVRFVSMQSDAMDSKEQTGYILTFELDLESDLESDALNDAIIECFDIGQRVSSSWEITGDVRDAMEVSGSSLHVSDSGVHNLAWKFR